MTTAPDNIEIPADDEAWVRAQIARLTFGAVLRSFRQTQDMTQDDCATILGFSKAMLSEYENGKKIPTTRKAYDIAKKLGIPPNTAVLLAVNDQLRRDDIPVKMSIAS
jgi:transcriptional regulator with XRE-family HTH domain